MSKLASSSSSCYRRSVTSTEAFCSCGSKTCIRTSWTKRNTGRRFMCCTEQCGWISWVDPAICDRSKQIIPGLLESIKKHEHLVKKNEELSKRCAIEVNKWKLIVFCSWFLMFVFVAFYFK